MKINKAVLLQGGLGNQLFIFAFCLERGYNLVFLGESRVEKYFDFSDTRIPKRSKLRLVFVILAKVINRVYWFKYYSKFFDFIAPLGRIKDIDTDENTENIIQKSLLLEGTFASIRFFENQRDKIQLMFKIKEKYQQQYKNEIRESQNKQNIVIHVRKTDYKGFGSSHFGAKDLCLPSSYYENSISSISNLSNYEVLIVTDDIEETKIMFKGIGKVLSCSEVVDFQIIMNADVVICANSTFSFWGALLNPRASKVIIPEYWLGFHVKKRMPENIFRFIPENWEVINFD